MDNTSKPLANLPRRRQQHSRTVATSESAVVMQVEKSGVFALEFVDRFKAKHHARKERKRLLRPWSLGGRRSVLRWRRTDRRDPLRKLSEPRGLHFESRRCRLLRATHDTDTNVHAQSRLEPSPDVAPPQSAPPPLHFSFSGGGWLMVYMYGVCKALRQLKVDERAKFIGTSAGCLSVVSLVLDSDFDAICDSVVHDYVPAARASWRGPFQMRDYLVDAVTRHANVDNIHKLHGKVTIVYTSLSAWATRRVSRFKNPVHLLQTMVASCCATPLVGLPFQHEGEYVVDGGLLDNQPLFEDGVRTITVTPNVFAAADIRPSRYVPPWWSMYPPTQREMRWLFALGYEDGLAWCMRRGLPGSEDVKVPTEAATFRGEWKTVVGQVAGYRSVEDAVLAVAGLLLLSEETVSSSVIRLEILLWRLLAVVAALLQWTTVLWAVLAAGTLVGLTLLGQHCTLEFVVVLGAHLTVAVLKLKEACWQVHSSSHWQELRDSLGAMEKHSATSKGGLTPQQDAMLAKWSYVYRFSSLLV